jgi:hypothetical protein
MISKIRAGIARGYKMQEFFMGITMFAQRKPLLRCSGLVLALLLPFATGCAQLRNEAVTVLENATRDVVNQALDNVFSALRSSDL